MESNAKRKPQFQNLFSFTGKIIYIAVPARPVGPIKFDTHSIIYIFIYIIVAIFSQT